MSEGFSIEKYVEKYYSTSAHVYETARLSVMLFDEINQKIEEMPPRHRLLLEYGAILHDIGYFLGSKNHNKYSAELIRRNGIEGCNEKEVRMIALIARYHRGSLPDKGKHDNYAEFRKTERRVIKKLAAILRLCDGIDSAHRQLIKSMTVKYDKVNKICKIELIPAKEEMCPDIRDAVRKKDLLEKAFQIKVVLKLV